MLDQLKDDYSKLDFRVRGLETGMSDVEMLQADYAALSARVDVLEGGTGSKYQMPTLPDPTARPFFNVPSGSVILERINALNQMGPITTNAARTGTGNLDRLRRFSSQLVMHHVDGSWPLPNASLITESTTEYNYFRLIYQAVILVCMELDWKIAEGLVDGKTLNQISIEQQSTIDWLVLQTTNDHVIWGRNGYSGSLIILIGLTLLGVHPNAETILNDGYSKMTNPAGESGPPGLSTMNLPAAEFYFPHGGHMEGNGYWNSMVSEMGAYDLWYQATSQNLRVINDNFRNQSLNIVYLRSEGANIPDSRYWGSQLTANGNECTTWAASQNLIETDEAMSANLVQHILDSGLNGIGPEGESASDHGRFDPAYYYVLFGSAVPLNPATQPAIDPFQFFGDGRLAYRNGRWAGVSAQDVHAGHRCAHVGGTFALMFGPSIVISGSRTEAVTHNYWSNNANEGNQAGWPFSGPYVLDSSNNFVPHPNTYGTGTPDNYTNATPKILPPYQVTPGTSEFQNGIHTMEEFQMGVTRTVDYTDSTRITITDTLDNPGPDRRLFVQFCGERLPEFDGIGWVMRTNANAVEDRTVRLVFSTTDVEARVGIGKPGQPDQSSSMPGYVWPGRLPETRGGWWQLNATDPSGTITTVIELN